MADNKSREINVSVDVDVESAIKGLKAIQREAKVAVKLLRELEQSLQGSAKDSE